MSDGKRWLVTERSSAFRGLVGDEISREGVWVTLRFPTWIDAGYRFMLHEITEISKISEKWEVER